MVPSPINATFNGLSFRYQWESKGRFRHPGGWGPGRPLASAENENNLAGTFMVTMAAYQVAAASIKLMT